jgi:hypothetical protein
MLRLKSLFSINKAILQSGLGGLILGLLIPLVGFCQTTCIDAQKDHARELVRTIPGFTQEAVNRNQFGDCIRETWMDEMKKLGVREVTVSTSFTWKGGLKKFKITKWAFYDG